MILIIACISSIANAQLSYGASAVFGLNKVNTSYSGNAVQIRRACDNATINVGFNSCGDLDTTAINNFVGLQNFPLTSLTSTATAAYSLRRVNCAYNGFAVNVRSTAAGNPTVNIGFTVNGDLDTTALKTFVGSNSAFITVWYDQSGNGKHVTQTIIANQPKIMTAGVISRQNGKPAINFISASSTNLYINALMITDKISISTVAKVNNAAARNTLFDLGAIPSGFSDFAFEANTFTSAGNKWGFYGNNNSLDGTVATSTNLTLLSLVAQNTNTASAGLIANTNFYVNSASSTLSCRGCVTNTYRASWLNGFVIGNFNGAYVSYLDGYMSELIIFPSALSTTERQFLEWTQSQYYGVTTGVALGTLPAGNLPSAFVTTWYDQSGNGKNITQAAASSQPRIVNTGVVDKQNNTIPAVYFNGSAYYLSASDAGLPTGDLSVTGVIKAKVTSYLSGNYGSLLHYGAAGTGSAVFATFGTDGNMGTNSLCMSQYGDAAGISNSLNSNIIYSAVRSVDNYSVLKNGGSLSNKVMTTNTILYGANGLSVGAFNPTLPGSYLNGYISELGIYPLAFSDTRRILLETNRSAFTAIPISNSKYTPPASSSYNRFVNGIGRELVRDTVLGTRQTVGMGMSSGTAAGTDFLQTDGDYMTFGINCPAGPGTSVSNLPATIVQRWINDWYINKTDVGTNGGTINLYFDYSDYGYTGGFSPGAVSNYELLYRNAPSGTFTIVTGTTKAVVGDRVEFNLDANLITTNFYYTIGTKNTSVSPLPIELLTFTATANEDHVDLNWATATETNNQFFTIEKSRNGVQFESVKSCNSKAVNGNSTVRLDYNDIDPYPYEGTSYYRLKQTDYNGSSKHSSIVDVYFSSSNEIAISVYPNPNQGEFILNFKGITKSSSYAQVTLFDVLGKKIYEESLSLSKDTNSFLIVPSQKMVKGIYFLSCVFEGITYTKKVVVN